MLDLRLQAIVLYLLVGQSARGNYAHIIIKQIKQLWQPQCFFLLIQPGKQNHYVFSLRGVDGEDAQSAMKSE